MNLINIKTIFGKCELTEDKIVIRSDLAKTLEIIKNDYNFNILKDITAIDNGENNIELIYRLYSTENDENVVISINVKGQAESVSKLYDSAVADEKEIYDLFGVNFTGNDELERLYMPEDWKGHPLLKNYEENDERLSWND